MGEGIHARRWPMALAPVLGAVATLGFAPLDAWPLTILALAGLLGLIAGAAPARAALLGWLFGVVHFGTGVYWVYVSTHVYGGAAAWLAVLLGITLFSYLGVYPALFAAAVARFGLLRRPSGWLAAPSLWLLLELVRGWFYSGFPWLATGYVALDTPLTRLAPLFGVHVLSAVIVLVALALYRLLAMRGRARIVAALVLAAPLVTWTLPLPGRWTVDTGEPLRVVLVQSNIRQDEKWLPHMRREALERHWRLTAQAWPADLIVWPEVALTQPYDVLKDDYLAQLHGQALARDATVLLGLLVGERGFYHNSVMTVGQTQGRYDKRHLVPFGEYFPVPDFIRPLMDVLDLPYSDFQPGAAAQEPIVVRGHKVAIGICFEDVFGEETRVDARGAGFLVNVTNDAWFAHTSAPWQHLQFSRMRSIETARWMARTANTGVSAFIDPNGRIVAQSEQYRMQLLRGTVQPREGETPYMRWGNAPLWALGIGGLLLALLRARNPA